MRVAHQLRLEAKCFTNWTSKYSPGMQVPEFLERQDYGMLMETHVPYRHIPYCLRMGLIKDDTEGK